MLAWCTDFLADEGAISAVEYCCLLGLIGAGILAAIIGLGNEVAEDYGDAAVTISG
jgi:Flp pilus assembly pilin Flp